MLLSGGLQAINALYYCQMWKQLRQWQSPKSVHIRKIQEILFFWYKRKQCWIGGLAFFFTLKKVPRAGFISQPEVIKFFKFPWCPVQHLRSEKINRGWQRPGEGCSSVRLWLFSLTHHIKHCLHTISKKYSNIRYSVNWKPKSALELLANAYFLKCQEGIQR